MYASNIANYERMIEEEKKLLTFISHTYDLVLTASQNKKNKNSIEKQKKLFYKLKSHKLTAEKYTNKTNTNLKKDRTYIDSEIIEKVVNKLKERKSIAQYFDDEIINEIYHAYDLKEALSILVNKYNMALTKIKMYEKSIEDLKKSEMNSLKDESKSQVHTEIKTNKNDKEPKESIIPPAKKNGIIDRLKGKDVNADKIGLLYGLAADLLIFMDADQRVQVKDITGKDTFSNVSLYADKETRDMALQTLLRKYNATSLESLLDVYDKLRNTYFKEYSKLSEDNKKQYEISNCSSRDITVSSSEFKYMDSRFYEALKNEGLKFPPSKQELINMMNQRILNGHMYPSPEPKAGEYVTSEANNIEQYMAIYKYYKNLTKNMTVEETAQLYHIIQKEKQPEHIEFRSEAHKTYYYSNLAIIQKLFGELIMEKKGISFVDSKQQRQVVAEIIKTELKEDLRIYVPKNEELNAIEKEKRHHKIHAEYLKYMASQKDKKNAMSFSEFIQKTYGLDKDEQTVLIEDTKGMKI